MIEERSRLERGRAGGPALVCGFVALLMGCGDSTSAPPAPDAAPDASVKVDTRLPLDQAVEAESRPDVPADAPGGVDTRLPLDEAVEAESRPDVPADVAEPLDTELSLDVSVDARRRPDAGACWYALSEIGLLPESWQRSAAYYCTPSISDNLHHTCDGGRGVGHQQCGQREVVSWGTWSTQCFYEAGNLVGIVLTSDIGVGSEVCNGPANFVEIGDTAGCPGPGVSLCAPQDAGVVDTGGM
jgi:hypothetical protein